MLPSKCGMQTNEKGNASLLPQKGSKNDALKVKIISYKSIVTLKDIYSYYISSCLTLDGPLLQLNHLLTKTYY